MIEKRDNHHDYQIHIVAESSCQLTVHTELAFRASVRHSVWRVQNQGVCTTVMNSAVAFLVVFRHLGVSSSLRICDVAGGVLCIVHETSFAG